MAVANLKINDWREYQHYSDKRVAWIKLYPELTRKWKFRSLPERVQLRLIFLWLVAPDFISEKGGEPCLPWNAEQLSLSASIDVTEDDLGKMIEAGWLIPVAASSSERLDNGYAEGEAEAEKEGERETARGSSLRDQARVVFEYWKRRSGHVKAVATEARLRVIEQRLKEQKAASTQEPWRVLLAAVEGAALLTWKVEGTERVAAAIEDFDSTFRNKGRDRIEKCLRLWREAGKPFPAEARTAMEEAMREAGIAVEEVAA